MKIIRLLVLATVAALATACSIGNEPPTAEVPDVQVPSMGSTVGPPSSPNPAGDDAITPDRYGPALNAIGRLQERHENDLFPGIHINDQDKFVLWVFTEGRPQGGSAAMAKAQKLVDKTGHAAQVELRPTGVPLDEVMALVDKVHAAVLAEDTGSFGVGPDFKDYPLVIARLPEDTSPDVAAKAEALSTDRVPVKVLYEAAPN